MYKKTEKKFNFLLDKLLLHISSGTDLWRIDSTERELRDVLVANKVLLPVSIQEKILQILPVSHSDILLAAFQSKDYQHLGCEVVKLLDLGDIYFSDYVIETLYKMGTYQFVDEIRQFSTLSIDDKIPFNQESYRTGLECYAKLSPDWFLQKYHKHNRMLEFYAKYPPSANRGFEWINNTAKKYIKRAGAVIHCYLCNAVLRSSSV